MSESVIFGLIGIVAGAVALGLGRLVRGVVVRGYSRTNPTADSAKYGSTLWMRMLLLASLMILIGVGFLVYGLAGGRLPGE